MEKSRKNIVGPEVKTAREQNPKGMTQDQLAVALQLRGWSDCDRFTVSKIELGTRAVSDAELLLLSEVLKKSADWLLRRKGTGESS
jgi:transcriptional regulator with XRE-family HTH domain